MTADVLHNKFPNALSISTKKLNDRLINITDVGDNAGEAAILSTFLPANFISSASKNNFKCARMEDCFYGDPKLTPPGKFFIRY